ncbi:hypothetical protein ACVWWN_003378 [Mycobacterium sp. URHB0021]
MRHAALHLLFVGLDGERATTRAWHDNPASSRVARSLPYTEDNPVQEQRRDRPDTMLRFSMPQQQWQTARRSDIQFAGIGQIQEFLRITTGKPAGDGG